MPDITPDTQDPTTPDHATPAPAPVVPAGPVLEVEITGPIGADYGEDSTSASDVAEALAGRPGLVKLRINSPGGDCFQALEIYNRLKQSGARIEVEILGLAASAASLIAMAGDRISMAAGSMMMLHNPWARACGNGAELREVATSLDKLRESFIGIYAARSGQAAADVGATMDAELWLTADEAVTMGLATELLADRPAATLRAAAFRKLQIRDLAPAAHLIVDPPKAIPPELPGVPAMAAMVTDPPEPPAPLEAAPVASVEPPAAPLARPPLPDFLAGLDLEAVQAAVREAPELRARVTEQAAEIARLGAVLEAQERATIVASLQASGQVTPAQVERLIPRLSMEALRDFQATAPRVIPASPVREPSKALGAARLVGRPFGELSPAELHELRESDPDAYAAAKRAAGR